MKAMVLKKLSGVPENRRPLVPEEMPDPVPGPKEILVKVSACGVCHTELDEIEGRTPPPELPVIPGHQVVGTVVARGPDANRFEIGNRVGVAWIFSACGKCEWCRRGDENLCDDFKATGRDAHGGYAEYMTAAEDFAFPIPERYSDELAAPLLCAGAIGYRSLRLSGIRDGMNLGLTGFGASAHLVLKMVRYRFPSTRVHVFARSETEQMFARELGAVWAGHTDAPSPEKLHGIIDTTPAWIPVVRAMENLLPGGRLVINAIRKEPGDKEMLLDLDYPAHLWMEKEIKSVANVARRDVREFLELADSIPILPEIETYPLMEANRALMELKERKIRGAKVLVIGH